MDCVWDRALDRRMVAGVLVGVGMAGSAMGAPPALVSGTFMKFAGSAGTTALYRVEVPEGQKRLSISTRGNNGDVDLYLVDASFEGQDDQRRWRRINQGDVLASSSEVGPRETLTIVRPGEGTHYVLVAAREESRNIRVASWLTARPGFASVPVLPVGQTVLISASRANPYEDCLELAIEVPEGSHSLEVRTWGGEGTMWLAEDGLALDLSNDTETYEADAEPRSGMREFMFCAQYSYSNVRVRADINAIPKVAFDGLVGWYAGSARFGFFAPGETVSGEVVGPAVRVTNTGAKGITGVTVLGVRLNGMPMPLASSPTRSIGALSSGVVVPELVIPLPLTMGMTATVSMEVSVTDFKGRSWTRTYESVLVMP